MPVNDLHAVGHVIMSEGCIQTNTVRDREQEHDALVVSGGANTSTNCVQAMDTMVHEDAEHKSAMTEACVPNVQTVQPGTEVARQSVMDREGSQYKRLTTEVGTGVTDDQLAKAAVYMQLESERLQDITSRVQHLQDSDEYMIDWLELDPLLEVNRVLSEQGDITADHREYFTLAKGLDVAQVQQRRELLHHINLTAPNADGYVFP